MYLWCAPDKDGHVEQYNFTMRKKATSPRSRFISPGGDPMQFTDVIDRRRSIRAYSAKVVPKSKLDAVLATVQRAPSAGDLQAYLVIIVESPETKALLAEAALGQSFIAEAPVVFVFLADTRRSESKYGSEARHYSRCKTRRSRRPMRNSPPQQRDSGRAGSAPSTRRGSPARLVLPLAFARLPCYRSAIRLKPPR
jgi:nitroreductase